MVSDFIAKKNRVVKDYKLADNSVPEETKKKLRSRLNICEISCTKFGKKNPILIVRNSMKTIMSLVGNGRP